jgi:peptide/nickel transport system substrate-binding protein
MGVGQAAEWKEWQGALRALTRKWGPLADRFSRRGFLQLAGSGALAATSAVALGACGSSASSSTSTTTASGKPRHGGTITAALTGGASSDTIDANSPVVSLDLARVTALYDPMCILNTRAQVENWLVEEFTPNADATVWTMRLRSGVTFHNGKPVTADDLIYTLRRITNPKDPLAGASSVGPCDIPNIKKLDNLTISVPCKTPYSTLVEAIAGYWLYFNIVPVDYDPAHPIGTGPFKFKSFEPGVQSVFIRNDNYWRQPYPYFDELVIVDSPSETSQVNALLSKTVDVVDNLSAASIAAVNTSTTHTVISLGAGPTPFTMRVDVAPFSDVRVRQALRLCIDRPKMREIVFEGHGLLGNDISSYYDPEYDHAIPQRVQDIPQAKALLKAAGQEGLTVDLVTADIASGTVAAATVLQQQASAAGITINLHMTTSTVLYGKEYLQWVFAQDFWGYTPYLPQVVEGFLKISPFNETHFNDPEYTKLYYEATATLDKKKQTDIAHEMQMIDWTRGGWIIPYFPPVIDGYVNDIQGGTTSLTGLGLGNFGFAEMWRS